MDKSQRRPIPRRKCLSILTAGINSKAIDQDKNTWAHAVDHRSCQHKFLPVRSRICVVPRQLQVQRDSSIPLTLARTSIYPSRVRLGHRNAYFWFAGETTSYSSSYHDESYPHEHPKTWARFLSGITWYSFSCQSHHRCRSPQSLCENHCRNRFARSCSALFFLKSDAFWQVCFLDFPKPLQSTTIQSVNASSDSVVQPSRIRWHLLQMNSFVVFGKEDGRIIQMIRRWLGFKKAMAWRSEPGTGCKWDRALRNNSTDYVLDGS